MAWAEASLIDQPFRSRRTHHRLSFPTSLSPRISQHYIPNYPTQLSGMSLTFALDKLHGKKQIEQVAMLTDFRMRPSDIAALLGLETRNVTAQLAQLKTRPRKRGAVEE